jgi:UDP-2,3-diacylglucosamine pyrophosphatase LpxH
MNNTLVVSDIHLGSPVCKVKAITSVLKNEKYDTLIINGDLLDNKYISRYKSKHWKVLNIIRRISKKKKVILIKGNHDVKAAILARILGLEFIERYEARIGEKNFLFMHFQQFDPFIFKHPFITHIAEQIYYFFQWIDRSKRIARFLKRNSKSFLNIRFNIRSKALFHIKMTKYDAICGGHIHYAEAYTCPDSGKEYYNSGSFCDEPCHYLLIDAQGNVKIKEI